MQGYPCTSKILIFFWKGLYNSVWKHCYNICKCYTRDKDKGSICLPFNLQSCKVLSFFHVLADSSFEKTINLVSWAEGMLKLKKMLTNRSVMPKKTFPELKFIGSTDTVYFFVKKKRFCTRFSITTSTCGESDLGLISLSLCWPVNAFGTSIMFHTSKDDTNNSHKRRLLSQASPLHSKFKLHAGSAEAYTSQKSP